VQRDLDALDRGVIEASTAGDRAAAKCADLVRFMREKEASIAAGDLPPVLDGGEFREVLGMASGHPESPAAELAAADEEMLAELCTRLWPRDEYTQITAADWQQRGNGATP